ncbi:ribonuclease activity regulator RraA [Bosea caraganae]|uniref:Ribonuclease activity regulator RraA n=1 Tax=Bosea caraganae TaxID=2763117 RepID=A0A370L715_9HYPH|nr:ribonuclease activity regulator RraA [Bosea caraganae]RDJ25423.1 ribonuclease activity regulator RraA [Bosea caraganae]RDJ25792.1 ribonuclease activity regulator RraA [Bosea caraganae]
MILTPENREKLKRVSTATLTTALFKRGFRNAFIQDVRPVGANAPRMVGEAYTLRYIPAREDLDHLGVFADVEHPQRKGVEACPPGHVMVIDSRKDPRAASAGAILVTRLMQRGVAGIVTDGGFRDSPDIGALPFPSYHTRPSAPTNLIRHHAADLNVPIACGDVAVYPGDIVVGDGEGVCVLPAHVANEVAEEAYEQTAYEDYVEERVRAGDSIFGLYPANEATKAAFAAWRPSWK